MLWWRILKTDDLKMPPSRKRRRVDFLGNSWSHFRIFWMLLGIPTEGGQQLWPLLAFAALPVSQNLATKRWIVLFFIRYVVLTKISPVLPLCQKHWFCGKLGFNDFIRCCVVCFPVWSILVSKQSLRSIVCNFGKKFNTGRFLGLPWWKLC